MPDKSDLFTFDLFGPVTVLTDDLVVFQGDIEHGPNGRKHEDGPFVIPKVAIAGEVEVDAEVEVEPRFLSLALACTPFLLVPSGTCVLSVPLFDVYPSLGTVRINVPQIIAISPFSSLCTVTGVVNGAG